MLSPVPTRERLIRRAEAGDAGAIGAIWTQRGDRYSEIRSERTPSLRRRIEMSYIGG